ncbi:DUF2383 domain-containing protein [Salipiger bermudensis]|uniref:DUF2383 domain-containing protein n=1 Tax=Salipiger bermudensis TaxID=344736 RepID=UPI00300A7B52
MTDPQPVSASDDQLSTLQDLLSRSAETHAWFEEMAKKAEPDFRHLALKFRGLHVEQCDRITAIMTALGGEPDRSGGVRAAVNRTSVSLRSLFEEIDDDMMSAVEDAEAQLLAEFDAALSSLAPSRYRDELEQMKAELVTLLSEEPGDA